MGGPDKRLDKKYSREKSFENLLNEVVVCTFNVQAEPSVAPLALKSRAL